MIPVVSHPPIGVQSMNKERKIKEQIKRLDQHLAAAEGYVARNVNVRGLSWLHLSDWKGKSGHPLWIKNYMMPSTQKAQAEKERALEKIATKAKKSGFKSGGKALHTLNAALEPGAVYHRSLNALAPFSGATRVPLSRESRVGIFGCYPG